MEPQEQVFTFLRDLGIPFDLVRHAPVDTMEDCAALGLSAPHCKNLFLCNRAKTQFYLLLLRADKPFVTREVSKTLACRACPSGMRTRSRACCTRTRARSRPWGCSFRRARACACSATRTCARSPPWPSTR